MKVKARKSAGSSPPERLVVKSEEDIGRYLESAKYKQDLKRLRAHLRKHGGEPSANDLAAIPALTEEELARMRPLKEQLTIRLDADVVGWLKSKPGPYQTRLNNILRAVMARDRGVAAKSVKSR